MVVKVIMAAAFCWNDASTAAIAMVVTVGDGFRVMLRSSLNFAVWNMAASAS